MAYYPDFSDDTFAGIVNKLEFGSHAADSKKSFVYQEPHQMLMRNLISKHTPYESILLYNQLGTGKTCSAIAIAEGFKEYVNNMGKRIVVLVKNKNIQRNFVNELLSKCTHDEYLDDAGRAMYWSKSSAQNVGRNELINKTHRIIHKTYQFITYGTFVNRVLGSKVYEKDKFGLNTSKVRRENGSVVRKPPKDRIRHLNNTVIIIDEAHNITNNDVYTALHQVLSRSYNFRLVLLTATPMYDNPREIFEISNLLNITNDKAQLPIRNELLRPKENAEALAVKVPSPVINGNILKGGIVQVTPAGLGKLRKHLYGKVSFLRANTDTNPTKTDVGQPLLKSRPGTTNVVYCPMSSYQYKTYLKALKLDVQRDSKYDISAIQKIEAQENLLETTGVSKTSSLYKNSSDASTMAYPDYLFGKEGFLSLFAKTDGQYKIKPEYAHVLTTDLQKYSVKLHTMLQYINQSPGNVFVYSNYVSYGGTSLVKQILLLNGYKEYKGSSAPNNFIVLDDKMSIESREKYRRIFNSVDNSRGEKIRIIVGSPIISEGITLKNVRQVHILEPSWNMSRINQIIGRAVRNYSHHALDEKDRTVDVYKYASVFGDIAPQAPGGLNNFFIDREKYILSEEKDRSNKVVERLLKEVSVDCRLMRTRNALPEDKAGSPDCDYVSCQYQCDISPTDQNVDKSTYNAHIEFFEKYDINFAMEILRNMFKKYFIWHINDIVSSIHATDPLITKEVIFTALALMTDNKLTVVDMYNRDGFIINRGPYYIFNDFEIDINTSLFSKMLDFSVDSNKFSLGEYVDKKLHVDLFDTESDSTRKKVKKDRQGHESEAPLSNADVKHNYGIIEKHKLFGTYRERGTSSQPFGPKDGKFRVVDLRNQSQSHDADKRKNISGMFIGSFKKPKLVEMLVFLMDSQFPDQHDLRKEVENRLVQNGWGLDLAGDNINITTHHRALPKTISAKRLKLIATKVWTTEFSSLDKEQLGHIIEKHMIKHKMVLR